MRDMYVEDEYAKSNPSWHEEDAGWKAAHIGRILRKNGVSPCTICEVGCGAGGILLALARALPKSHCKGYEISPYAYELCQKKLSEAPNISFHLGDPAHDTTETFDVLVLADVIEHVEDFMSMLKGLRHRAAYKVLHIPLDLSVQSVLRSWPILALRKNVGHIHYFYKDLALAALRDCGYTIVDHGYTASRIELPNQAWTSRVMALPRRACFAASPDLTVRVLGGYSLLVLAR